MNISGSFTYRQRLAGIAGTDIKVFFALVAVCCLVWLHVTVLRMSTVADRHFEPRDEVPGS